MRRLWPQSLVGRVMLLVAAALLVAQLINFALLLSEGQRARLAQSEGPAFARLVDAAATAPARREAALRALSRRGARFWLTRDSIVERRNLAREPEVERRIAAALAEAGLTVAQVQAGEGVPRRQRARVQPDRPTRLLLVSLGMPDGSWLNARFPVRRADPGFAWRLLAATLALYALVLGAVLLVIRQLARPLHDMTHAAENFGGRDAGFRLDPHGPADLKRLAQAFNDMRARVVELVADKDRMIGAIGHDLRTPLASLRIRAEAVPEDAARDRMVATIESMDQTLGDILALARAGQPAEPERPVDVASLVDTIVEDYRDMGADVTFAPAERLVATIRANALARAVRNLIDNGIKYGGRAQLRIERQGGIRIIVEDDGPGVPASELTRIADPFYRIEPSRNRNTGGTGLGLAIARTIAEAHGGGLKLENRAEGGLRATLVLPMS